MRKVNLLKTSGLLASIGLIGSVSFISSELHPVPLLVFTLSLIIGFIIDKKPDRSIIRPAVLFIMVFLCVILSLIGINEEILFQRVFGLLLLITSAKLISPKKSRDILQLYLLNFFVITGSAVTRLDLGFAALVLSETYLSIFGLLLIYGSKEQNEISTKMMWKLSRWSGIITASLIPATVIIFLITPRPTMTIFAWGSGVTSQTGFSDKVDPGAVEEIKANESPAFRAMWFEGIRPIKPRWRGIVYDRYDNGVWFKSRNEISKSSRTRAGLVEYEIILEPTDTRYLITLGVPVRVSMKVIRTRTVAGYTVEANRNINRRIIYRAISYLTDNLPADLSPDFYLQVPPELEFKLYSIASGFIGSSDIATATAIEEFLINDFLYDLSPGRPTGDPVLYFLEESKKGHCEYFASSMTLLLRSLGIPARMVGGYSGGNWNEMGKYYLVRQSDAHTWVEVWDEDKGWVTFDPTPGTVFTPKKLSLTDQLYEAMDMLRLKWYYWIIGYNINRQIDIARKASAYMKSFRMKNIDFMDNMPEKGDLLVPVSLILIIAFIAAAIKLIMKKPKTPGEKFVSLLDKYGYSKEQGQTLKELTTGLNSFKLRKSAQDFTKKYYLFEYNGKGEEAELNLLLKRMEENLKKAV